MSSAENKASTYMNLSPYSLLVNIFQAHNSPIVQIVQASARQVHHIHNLMVQYVSLIAVTVNSSLWGCIVLHYVKGSLHLQAGNFSYIANLFILHNFKVLMTRTAKMEIITCATL